MSTCGPSVASLLSAAVMCCPLLVWSGGAGESVGAREVTGGIHLFIDALAALIALLSVPGVSRLLTLRLLLMHLSRRQHFNTEFRLSVNILRAALQEMADSTSQTRRICSESDNHFSPHACRRHECSSLWRRILIGPYWSADLPTHYCRS